MKKYNEPILSFRSFGAESIITSSQDLNGNSIQMVLDNIAPAGSGVNMQVIVENLGKLQKMF